MLHPQCARRYTSGKDVCAPFGGSETFEGFLTIRIGSGELTDSHAADALFGCRGQLLFKNGHTGAVARFQAVSPEARYFRRFCNMGGAPSGP